MTALSPPFARPPEPPAAAATRRPATPATCADGLSRGQRRLAVAVIVAAHGAGVWALMQVADVREAADEALPMFVDLIAPAAPAAPAAPNRPAAPVPPIPLAPPPVVPRRQATAIQRPTPPSPTAPALIAAAADPSPTPAAFTAAPLQQEAPVQAATAPLAAAPVVAAAERPASAAAPRTIAPSSVQYLVEPAPDYPRASSRNREAGRVLVLVFIDEAGLPRQVQLARSSGFGRLDDAAVAAVAASRFRPPTVNGQPVSGWTHVPIDFALETPR